MELFRKKKDMSKYDKYDFASDDLELILTQKCNFTCEHCMRGECSNKEITEDVLDATFKKFIYIENLALGGGEIALAPHLVRLVTKKLKENDVVIHHVNFTSNGTIVSDELLSALKELEDYIHSCDERSHLFKYDAKQKNVPMFVCFSFDDYHLNQMIKKGITLEDLFDNIAKYQKVFGTEAIECRMESDMDVYDAGRASTLPSSSNKVSIEKMLRLPYPFIDLKNEAVLIGNVITISCDGEVIPPNIPFAKESELSFGNVKTVSNGTLLSNLNAYETNGNGYNKSKVQMYKAMTAPKKLQKRYHKVLSYKLNKFYEMLEEACQRQQ